jgi:hypothetical protein
MAAAFLSSGCTDAAAFGACLTRGQAGKTQVSRIFLTKMTVALTIRLVALPTSERGEHSCR